MNNVPVYLFIGTTSTDMTFIDSALIYFIFMV